jgi:PIN domain
MTTAAKIGVDTQIISYLLMANTSDVSHEANEKLKREKMAIQALWLSPYCDLFVAPTVWKEIARIPRHRVGTLPNMTLREQNVSTLVLLFNEIFGLDTHAVDAWARYYNQFHKDMDDCYLIAESEEAALDVVPTYDQDLLKHLRHRANISLMRPSEYEDSLN